VGLGWVNYRRGNFREARQFFLALLEMEPFGQKAAASVYWAGRCAQELGDLGIAAGEWTMLMRRFPVSYYAHRASEGLAKLSPRIVALKADLPVEDEDDRVGMIGELVAAGLHDKALKHMRQLVPSARENAGPRTLEKLNHMALNIGARYLAAKFRGIRNRRFPRPDQTTIRTLAANFPRSFLGLIDREASKRRLEEPLVVALVRQESGFNSRAISPMGAMGLMQLMPQTAAGLLGRAHAEKSVNPEEILRPSTNVRLGCRYLSRLLKMFGNVDEFALAAYNAGPRAVNRWRRRGDSTVEVFVEEIPYDETRDYVKKVLSWKRKYEYLQGLRSKRAKRATGVAKVLGQPG